jgi:Cullin family
LKDRVYTKSADVPEIREAGLDLFLKHIIRPPIDKHLVSAILTQIQVERDGHVINRSAVKGCVDVFLGLHAEPDGPSVYKQELEPAILQESQLFYQNEGRRLLVSCDAPEYLRRVSKLTTICEEQLISKYPGGGTSGVGRIAQPSLPLISDCSISSGDLDRKPPDSKFVEYHLYAKLRTGCHD